MLAWKASPQPRDTQSPPAHKPLPSVSAALQPINPVDAPAPVKSQDLSVQPAGALTRRKAIELRQAAPVQTFLARALMVHTDERAWRIGADGERKVATQLKRLALKDGRWRFLHSIPVGCNGADIDHLVIGPGGVYALNAKHHPKARIWVGGDTFMVNGHRHPYIRNSRHEALRSSRLLSAACGFRVPVTGLVVPVGADTLTIKAVPEDVGVVNRMALVKWLQRQRPLLNDATIDSIFDAARRSTTWRP